MYYFGCDFLDCCLHLYYDKLKHNISVAVSSGLLQVSFIYLNIEMTQPGKLFLNFTLIYYYKNGDNSPTNHNQSNTHQASSQKFRQIIIILRKQF